MKIKSIILVLFILAACKKKEPPTSTDTPSHSLAYQADFPSAPIAISDSAALLCKFKSSSYWIFQDSISNSIDTLVMTQEPITDGSISFLSLGGCELESRLMALRFKGESSIILSEMRFHLQNDVMLFASPYFYTQGGQAMPAIWLKNNKTKGFVRHDSLLLNGQLYRGVGQSYAIEFITTRGNNDTTRMYPFTLTLYFCPGAGFLQFDLRDLVNNNLFARWKLMKGMPVL